MSVFMFIAIIAVIEIIFTWGKITANKNTEIREGKNYRVPLFTSGPWWVRLFHKLWFSFHFLALLALVPLTLLYAASGRNGQLDVSTIVIHALNFVILAGGLFWLFA